MSFLLYSIAAIIAFSGLLAGVFLALHTKEEMPTAKRYFPWAQRILILIMVALFFDHFKVMLFFKIAIYALIVFSIVRKPVLNYYPFIALLFFFLGQSNESLLAIATVVFLYGFPTGSLFVINHKMKPLDLYTKTILRYGLFLVISLLAQLLYSVFVIKQF